MEVLFGYVEFPIKSVLLQTENEILSEAWLSLDQLPKLYELWTRVIFSLENRLENLYDPYSVAVYHLEVTEVFKTVRVIEIVAKLSLVFGIFLCLLQYCTPYKINSSMELVSIFLKL